MNIERENHKLEKRLCRLTGQAIVDYNTVVVKLFVAKRDQLKGGFWALVRAPVCLG